MKPNKVKIILIEDDEDDQLLFSMALDTIIIPTELTIIKNAKELQSNIHLIQNLLPDIIIIDIELGVVDGLDYLEKIRSNKSLKETPCIILTDSFAPSRIEKAYNSGANLYIVKPVDFSELINLIRKICELNWSEYFPPRPEVFYVHDKSQKRSNTTNLL
ncbi:response regulator [Emticicia sp. C21]|uniref:response regulator n=1 Tax=Emticicia sp. C21 TaxID=2302915 RepID=UPI000E34C0C6|nr:response regulator [Emticicia sp. C21]RFS13811.1 DNA-binding response regulator [Emticicia sp. C21]